MEQVKIEDLNKSHVTESAKQTLVKSVHETEKRLEKEGKLVNIRFGSAFVSTTSPEKYKSLINY